MVIKKFKCPLGELVLVADEKNLLGVLYSPNVIPGLTRDPWISAQGRDDKNNVLPLVEQQLTEYFAGKRKQFELPLRFKGTDFQKRVWAALLTIPYGETRSYAGGLNNKKYLLELEHAPLA